MSELVRRWCDVLRVLSGGPWPYVVVDRRYGTTEARYLYGTDAVRNAARLTELTGSLHTVERNGPHGSCASNPTHSD